VRSTPSPLEILRTVKPLFKPAIALGDHDAFIGLHALAGAFDDVDADDHGVAGREGRNFLAQTGNFFLLKGLDQIHELPL